MTDEFVQAETEGKPRKILESGYTAFAFFVTLLFTLGALFPTGQNWGYHQLAFFPVAISVCFLTCTVALLFPPVQSSLSTLMRRMITLFERAPRSRRFFLAGAAMVLLAALFWVARERTFLLGDGSLIIRNLGLIRGPEAIPDLYRVEPLHGYLTWKLMRVLTFLRIPSSGELAIRLLSISFGLAFVLVLVPLARFASLKTVERLLVVGFVLVSGGSELFFGYAENYSSLSFGIVLFLWSGLAFLNDRCSVVFPAAAFGLLFVMHFGVLFMLPAVILLFSLCLRNGHYLECLLGFVAMICITIALLWLCGYSAHSFFAVFGEGNGHILPIGSIISAPHLLEWANLHLLIAPFALFSLAVSVIVGRRYSAPIVNRNTVFVLIMAGFGMLFTIVTKPDLGMSRDWDLYAPFLLSLIITAAFLMMQGGNEHAFPRQRIMTMVVGITFLHTCGWVGINANEGRSLARFELLPENSQWERKALVAANEESAIYFREHGDNISALKYFAALLELDSTNGRFWGNVANIYQLLGDNTSALACYENAAKYGASDEKQFIYLGIAFSLNGKFDQAIASTQKALEINPRSLVALDNIGVFLCQGAKNYPAALTYFLRTIELDSTYAKGYFDAGLCYHELRDRERTEHYFTRCIQLKPAEAYAARAQHLLDSLQLGGK